MKEEKNKRYFETQGFSMWPFLRREDRIVVEEAGFSELDPGDLVVYDLQGQPVCHRLVKKKASAGSRLLFTRGDFVSSWKTETVDEAQLKGRVSAIIRGTRIISVRGGLSALTGRLIILFFPVAAWAVARIEKFLRKR